MVVNDCAYLLGKRGALESIASKLAPTISLTEQHWGNAVLFRDGRKVTMGGLFDAGATSG
jgi:hypothetical protein